MDHPENLGGRGSSRELGVPSGVGGGVRWKALDLSFFDIFYLLHKGGGRPWAPPMYEPLYNLVKIFAIHFPDYNIS